MKKLSITVDQNRERTFLLLRELSLFFHVSLKMLTCKYVLNSWHTCKYERYANNHTLDTYVNVCECKN